MKKLIALLLALVMVLSLVACGAEKEAAPAATEAAPAATEAAPAATEAAPAEDEHEEVVLTAWTFEDDTKPTYQKFADELNAKYPWITIEWEYLPSDTGAERISVAYATQSTPDLMYTNYDRMSPAVVNGLCVDLTDIINNNMDYLRGKPSAGIVDGKNYYIPTGIGTGYGIAVNMDLANELGVADMLPADGLTWSYEDFLAVCRAAKAADPDVIPLALFAGSQSSDAWYYSWFLANGAEITSVDNSTFVVNEGENKTKILEALNVFKTLTDEGLTIDGVATTIDQDAHTFFLAGQSLFAHCGFNNASYFTGLRAEGSMADFKFDIVGIPTAEGKNLPRSSGGAGSGWVGFVNDGSKVEAVKLALEFLVTEANWAQDFADIAPGSVFTFKRVNVEYKTEEEADIIGGNLDFFAQYAVGHYGIAEPWWSNHRKIFYTHMQDLYSGAVDAETMVANWAAAGNKVISEYDAG